jgi:hypothetical protein
MSKPVQVVTGFGLSNYRSFGEAGFKLTGLRKINVLPGLRNIQTGSKNQRLGNRPNIARIMGRAQGRTPPTRTTGPPMSQVLHPPFDNGHAFGGVATPAKSRRPTGPPLVGWVAALFGASLVASLFGYAGGFDTAVAVAVPLLVGSACIWALALAGKWLDRWANRKVGMYRWLTGGAP